MTCALESDRLRNDLPASEEKQKNGQIGCFGFRQTAQVARATVSSSRVAALAEDFFGAKKKKKKMKTSEKGSRREVEAPSKGRAAPRPRWLSQVARATPAAAAPRTTHHWRPRQRHLG